MSFYTILILAIVSSITLVVGSVHLFKFIEFRVAVRKAEAAAVEYRRHQAPTTANAAAQAWLLVGQLATTNYRKQYASTEYQMYKAAAQKQRLDW